MRNEIEKVLEAMREDYVKWSRRGFCERVDIRTEMEEDLSLIHI